MPHTTIQAYAALAVKFHLLPEVEPHWTWFDFWFDMVQCDSSLFMCETLYIYIIGLC